MSVVQRLDRFQFHDSRPLDEEIGTISADGNSVVPNFNTMLLINYKVSLTKLMGQRVLVNLFQKTAAKTIRNRKRTPNDLL